MILFSSDLFDSLEKGSTSQIHHQPFSESLTFAFFPTPVPTTLASTLRPAFFASVIIQISDSALRSLSLLDALPPPLICVNSERILKKWKYDPHIGVCASEPNLFDMVLVSGRSCYMLRYIFDPSFIESESMAKMCDVTALVGQREQLPSPDTNR